MTTSDLPAGTPAEALLATKPALVILDTETTGLDHKTERLIEIAAVKLSETYEVIETFSELINPEVPIRHSSFLIHNISEEMVADAPTIAEVLPRFLAFMGDLPYAAHNAIFDYSFINEARKSVEGERFRNPRIDTLDMYRSVFPDEPSHSLSSLLARFGFDPEVKHRALDDAEGLAKVYPKLRELYEQRYAWQLAQLPNVPYLLERYLRIQKAIQLMQSEMSDLKEVFKLYFAEGGKSVEATTGETMVYNYRRTYEYDNSLVWAIVNEAGLAERASKLNPRMLDKLVDQGSTDEDIRERLKEARTNMTESRAVTFLKPQPPGPSEDSSEP